ncbi:hypothetical protein M427DRAFT_152560 [Gonapodya prolifera JEL478]|uniref:Proline-rich protein PRCC n=1 Tax=Gonapodya prolifera (strain JEL478) TaxID=1344416 RepID=A0A139ASG4_GONPJ|nr:hypothetical protein M427DRAFT_152560 [Gonapodya prolifera JEL478]|eukprot:KXS19594.1 hypothetical protein M427DRAFT_152560 [Gonapodya prolifera JEL478]
MSLPLANYGSDASDNDSDADALPAPAAPPASRKRPPLSLDEGIARLTKRRTPFAAAHDAGDDDDDTSRNARNALAANPGAGSVSGRSSGLFAFLPPPVNKSKPSDSSQPSSSVSSRLSFLPPPRSSTANPQPAPTSHASPDPPPAQSNPSQPALMAPPRLARQPKGAASAGATKASGAKAKAEDETASDMFFSFATPDPPATDVYSDDTSSHYTSTSLFSHRTSTRPDVSFDAPAAPATSLSSEYTAVESYEDFYAANQVEDVDALPDGVDREQLTRMQGKRNAAIERGNITFAEVRQTDQARRDEFELQKARELSEQENKTDLSKFQHLAPSNLQKKKHNIRALAYDAKVRSDELAAKAAHRRSTMKMGKAKYGF